MTITSVTMWNTHVFEVVDKIPRGFFVWNIGEIEQHEDYLPLCECSRPNDPECYDINPHTLKAIRLDPETVKLLRDAAHFGINNLENARNRINGKLKGYTKGHIGKRSRELAAATVDIFATISE